MIREGPLSSESEKLRRFSVPIFRALDFGQGKVVYYKIEDF
jgi:hypothetical protein